jgi:hypothetical protein
MTNLLSFLSIFFYLALAIIFAVAIIEQRRAENCSATEQTHGEGIQKAA